MGPWAQKYVHLAICRVQTCRRRNKTIRAVARGCMKKALNLRAPFLRQQISQRARSLHDYPYVRGLIRKKTTQHLLTRWVVQRRRIWTADVQVSEHERERTHNVLYRSYTNLQSKCVAKKFIREGRNVPGAYTERGCAVLHAYICSKDPFARFYMRLYVCIRFNFQIGTSRQAHHTCDAHAFS